MSILLQLTINGLIAGSIYALIASGFALIYKTNKFMHFAHGAVVAFSAYILYSLFSIYQINFYISVLLTLIFSGFLGWLIYFGIYSRLQKKKSSNVILLVASIGILILIENLIQLHYGADVKTIGYIEVVKGMEFFGAIITPLQVWIVATSLVLLVGLYLFMKKTKLGRDMRAVADNRELAEILGIDYKKIASYSFILGSMVAGIAGILIGLEQNLVPTMGTMLGIKGFTGAIMGGISSVPASILGSYILGFAENYGIWYLPSGYKDAIAFILLFLFLLFKPKGLFGFKKEGRE
jgi:branched-chain amino acid transport system permease protein